MKNIVKYGVVLVTLVAAMGLSNGAGQFGKKKTAQQHMKAAQKHRVKASNHQRASVGQGIKPKASAKHAIASSSHLTKANKHEAAAKKAGG